MNASWLPRTDLETGFAPLEPNHAPTVRTYSPEPAADIVAHCPHCDARISAQRLAEHGGCNRCGTRDGWSDSFD